MSLFSTPIAFSADGANNLNLQNPNGTVTKIVPPANSQTYTLPNKSGTFALISDINGTGNITGGTATLASGTVIVAAPQVTSKSKILVCYNTMSTSLGSTNSTATLAVPSATIVPGVGFTINSYLTTLGGGTAVWTTDNSTVNFLIIG